MRMLKKSILMIIALAFCFSSSMAQDLFTVENIEVDVTAENAIAAREKAFEEAQLAAFKALAERLLDEEQAKTYQVPALDTVSATIKDYEITKEKLSAVRYIGTYTFRFRDSSVRKLFGQSGQSYSDVQSNPLLVLPFLENPAGKTTLWGYDNFWLQAWGKGNHKTGLVPMVVPMGDLQDIRDITDEQAMNFTPEGLSKILDRYNADEAVIMIAAPDATLAALKDAQADAAGSVTIKIYRTDRGPAEYTDEITVTPSAPDQTVAALYEAAVARAKTAIRSDWKAKTVANAALPATSYMIDVPIASLQEWTQMQRSLGATAGIQGMQVRSLKPRMAKLTISFLGDEQRLALALSQQNLALRRSDSGFNSGYYPQGFVQIYVVTRAQGLPAAGGSPFQHTGSDSGDGYMQRF